VVRLRFSRAWAVRTGLLVILSTFRHKEPFGRRFLQILQHGCGFSFVIYY